jgi:NADP-dependent 3-hydroxy acid dehydrogenase YdfG
VTGAANGMGAAHAEAIASRGLHFLFGAQLRDQNWNAMSANFSVMK